MWYNLCLCFQPLYGLQSIEHIPFRFASGGGRELHFVEDKELEISEMVSGPTPRLPVQITIKRKLMLFHFVLVFIIFVETLQCLFSYSH